MKIAVCTGGGDCPGLNAAIRAIVKHARCHHDMEVVGVLDSFQGMIFPPYRLKDLEIDHVTDIFTKGGTILGTNNKDNPYQGISEEQSVEKTLASAKKMGIDALIVIGGEGTQGIAHKLYEAGLNIIGIPKTIDNDLPGTEQTLGFSSCVDLVADSVVRLQSTAESHDRIMILEVMGRDSGYIALWGGVAGGAHAVLIPEIPFSYEAIIAKINERKKLGRKYSVIVVSEGAYEKGENPSYHAQTNGNRTLGGIGQILAQGLYERSQMDIRVTVLGHLQRGGSPNATDRILASSMGCYAVDLAAQKAFGQLVVMQKGKICHIPYSEVKPLERRIIQADNEILRTAKSLGICLGHTDA